MKESERLQNSRLNIYSNVFIYFIQTILTFLVRTFFIRVFGAKLLGLDSLLINILNMLSIAELGIGSAISYGLYKPLKDNNTKKINAYMSFYRKFYRFIGISIISMGIILSLFLNKMVGDYSYNHLYLIYFIYLFDTSSLYFISYKDILLLADQKNYKIFKYDCSFRIILYVLQLTLLIIHPNYIVYLLIMLFSRLGNRILVNRFISRYYKKVDFKSKEKLTKKELKTIKSNVSGLFLFKLSDYVINCSDNIIISAIIDIVTVGIYTNYLSITTILKTIIRNIFTGITASFGNLSTEGDKKREKNVFEIMIFIDFIVSGYVTLCFLNMINPFIQIWLGKKYVLPYISMIIICLNFYLMCSQLPLDTVKEACGFYKKDKYVPAIQSIINVILSIVLAYSIGFNGVIIATTISYILTVTWIKPFMLHKYIFKVNSKSYFIDKLKFLLSLIVIFLIDYKVLSIINFSTNLINLIISGIIISFIYILMIILFYHNRKEFKYLYKTVLRKE